MEIKLFKYSETEFSFLSDYEIAVGDEIKMGTTKDGMPINRIVEYIIEQRPSKGIFSQKHPIWTKLFFSKL
jgi:hypothetical protein